MSFGRYAWRASLVSQVSVTRGAPHVKHTEARMRSEEDIRLMRNYMRQLVAKYAQIKQEAADHGDSPAQRVAGFKEMSYRTTALALDWALGEIDAQIPQEDLPNIKRAPSA